MFESQLKSKLKEIFGIKKVTYDAPSEANEQECLFVEIVDVISGVKDTKALSKITGSAVLFGNADKLPFGFFAKRIKQARLQTTKDFFFYDLESNSRIYQNIVQRSFSFVYFFEEQYDPDQGTITSVEIDVEEQ